MFDIKKTYSCLGPVVTHLINIISEQAVIPDDLKSNIIRAIYAKHTDVQNYKPISILPALEKLLCIKLDKYFEFFSLLDPNQYGF